MIPPVVREKIPQHATDEAYCNVNNETWALGRIDGLPQKFVNKYPKASKSVDRIYVGLLDRVSPWT